MLKEILISACKELFKLAKLFFFPVSLGLTIGYFCALYVKVTEPHYKNLNGREFFWCGIVVILLVFLDFLIARSFIRYLKKRKRKQ
jgi:hypothetical protein